MAESEIEDLRENLANEKTRIFDLEKELKNLKASCTCFNIKPTEVPSTQTDANSETDAKSESDASASPEENKPSSSESSDEVLEIMIGSRFSYATFIHHKWFYFEANM